MRKRWEKYVIVALLPLLLLSGCKKKRPPVSAQQQAPTITQPQSQQPQVAQPPTIACSTNPANVKLGDASTITCQGSSPEDRPLMYNCVPSDGRITRANPATAATFPGSILKLDTAGVSTNSITVTCSVTDDRGLSAATNTAVKIELPPPAITAKPKSKPNKRQAAKKPAEQKDKTIVNEGGNNGTTEPLSAGIPQDAATQQRRSTAQLRETTESNLRRITRQLTSDEQAIVQQVKMFLSQSRAADSDGDIERAYRLALKAQLLSEELVKR